MLKTRKKYQLEWLLREKLKQQKIKELEIKLNIQNVSLAEAIVKIKQEIAKND